MKIAALIIGIDGWREYTLPLIKSIQKHEPDCQITVIDNASSVPYPDISGVIRTERLCYSAAINKAHWLTPDPADWYIVLSNDVLCTGPFAHMLEQMPPDTVVGPQIWTEHGYTWLVGWCVAIPSNVWNALGGWDENYRISSWEDVCFSTTALERGYNLAHAPDLPFTHLDQRQRFTLIPNYWESENHNRDYFMRKHGAA